MPSDPPRRDDALHYATVLLALFLATVHFYLGTAVESPGSHASTQFFVVGAVFLLAVGIYLTSYFRPVLYLLGSLYAGVLGVLWFLGGMEYVRLGIVTGIAGAVFMFLTVYLFVREEFAVG